ncbi:MAG: histidinol-phosphatase HisJ family protein [Mariprofundaceae bacterium]|nr:histidinol-phosphatase HisJ family protein [Mariprofundaceae bacterium]
MIAFFRYDCAMLYSSVPDYHMHTPRCNHASGTIMEYAEAALRCGLHEIGISDHCPMPHGFDAEWRMEADELDGYLEEVQRVQAAMQPQGLIVRCGLEADFHPSATDYIQSLLTYHNWDYVIGSVHFIDDWGFDNPDEQTAWERWGINEAWCAYFDAVAASANAGLFDIIGHPDLLKKYGHKQPNHAMVHVAENRMLAAVKLANIALEISAAGLRKPIAEIYPRSSMVVKAAKLGIPFAYGSDAHAPQDVGHAMQECLQCLQQHNITHVAQFSGRKRCMQEITHVR